MTADDRQAIVLMRVEGGAAAGWGHLARCSALAEAIEEHGLSVLFVTRGEAVHWLRMRGLRVLPLMGKPEARLELLQINKLIAQGGVKAVVVDLPDRHGSYEKLRQLLLTGLATESVLKVAIVDRQKPPRLKAEVVINGHANSGCQERGVNGQIRLFGLCFQPIRAEFVRGSKVVTRKRVRQVLVSLGGARQDRMLKEVIQAVRQVLPNRARIIVAGRPIRKPLADESHPELIIWLKDPHRLAVVAKGCDMAIISGGQLKYEMASLGVPAVVIPVVKDQMPSCRAWRQAGGVVIMPAEREQIGDVVRAMLDDRKRQALSRWGCKQLDGRGAQRIARRIAALIATSTPKKRDLQHLRLAGLK